MTRWHSINYMDYKQNQIVRTLVELAQNDAMSICTGDAGTSEMTHWQYVPATPVPVK